MKRLMVFIMIGIFLMLGAYSFMPKSDLMLGAEMQIFVSAEQDFKGFEFTKNGSGFIVYCDATEEHIVDGSIKGIVGKTYIFNNSNTDYKNLIKSLNVLIVEKSDTSLLGYTDYFDFFVLYNGKKVNVQTYYNGEKTFIGTPLLLGSY